MKSQNSAPALALLTLGLVLSGCGQGGEEPSSADPSPTSDRSAASEGQESPPRLFNVIRDRSVELNTIGKWSEAVRLPDDVSAIAHRGDDFWAGCEDGTLARVIEEPPTDAYGSPRAKIAQTTKLEGAIAFIKPLPDSPELLVGTLNDGYNGLWIHAIDGTDLTSRAAVEVILGDNRPGFSDAVFDGKHLYVLTARRRALLQIDPQRPDTYSMVKAEETDQPLTGNALAWGKGHLWLLKKGENGSILRLDPGKPGEAESISLPDTGLPMVPDHLRFTGDYLYTWKGETIAAIDPGTHKVTGTHTLDSTVRDVERIGSDLFVGYFAGIDRLDPVTLDLKETIHSYAGENFIPLDP